MPARSAPIKQCHGDRTVLANASLLTRKFAGEVKGLRIMQNEFRGMVYENQIALLFHPHSDFCWKFRIVLQGRGSGRG